MIIVWSLTVAGFIIIFVEIGGWTSVETSKNPHALIGCVTTGLAFIQPFMAYFRPHPGTSKRFIFNWAHWLVGNSAHILASQYNFSLVFHILSWYLIIVCFYFYILDLSCMLVFGRRSG